MKYLLKLILISLSFEVFSNDLLSIYKEALDKDPEFNSKKADLAISKESLNQSRSGLLPQVRVTGGTNWNEYYQDRELQNDYNTFSYGLNISQPLFRLDKWFLNKQAKENLEAAEAQFAYQQQELIIKVTRAYFKVLSARANLEAKVATEKALRNQYDSVLERFNTGSVSRIELAEAKAALNRAESDRVQAEGNVDISFEELNSIVGRQVKLITPLNTSLDYIAPRTDVENEVSKGLTNNYLIIEAKNRLEAADANTKSKSSNYLPKIDLNANANRRTSKQYTFDGVDSNIDLPFTIPTETENRIYSIQFSMPLFTSGLNNSQRRQALLQEVKSEEQLILVERGIVQQIRTLHTALRTSELNIASLKSAVESSKDALEATKLGYELNSRNLIDLLQAEKNYSESINNLSQATYGFIVTSLQYKQAIGNLVPGDVVELNKQFK
ncbi:MAG: TolC family outer membrane protein [Pseudomonadota bacterium]|jgi:outer membrane protein|uniref:Outer membrane protein n=1 Tax=uncultured gamma proteobacterium HF0010_11B23 TaxID=710979 RepID=E0XQT6_9GAMM|nr:outer membrane protein [uncultured gamma proteobacterium HF0010_11B23]MEC7271670.1 TolC family outer membrane protein [Pseudomonadota bacterium]|tara:strand:- start:2113 stop:3438 length:1326 start_codon:yes stop_codon:yes gene_type:complete